MRRMALSKGVHFAVAAAKFAAANDNSANALSVIVKETFFRIARSVDVRLAFLPGVINVDGLHFRIEIDRFAAHFAQSDAGGLHSAKGHLRFAADGWGIDVRDAGFDAVDEIENLRGVIGVDRTR